MKKTLLFAALWLGLMVSAQAQDARGHVGQRFERGGLSVSTPADFCNNQLHDLYQGTTFQVTSEQTDRYGLHHIRLQQYVDGVRVAGMEVILHLRQGRVVSMNGNVLTTQLMASTPAQALHRAPMRATEVLQQAGLDETLAEHAEYQLIMIDGVCHQAYSVSTMQYQYTIDALSGEVLARVSRIMHLAAAEDEDDDDDSFSTLPGVPAEGFANTYYSGYQSIPCCKIADDEYVLGNHHHKLWLMDLSVQRSLENGITLDQISEFENYDSNFGTILLSGSYYGNTSNMWTDTYLESWTDSLVFHVDCTRSEMVGRQIFARFEIPDFDTFITDTVTIDANYVTLHLASPFPVPDAWVDLTLYTYDPATQTSEEYSSWRYFKRYNVLRLPISDIKNPSNEEQKKQKIEDSELKGTLWVFNSMEGYQPATDIIWGMTKTMDFYEEMFGLNSFDGEGTDVFCFANPIEKICEADNACAMPQDKGVIGIMVFGMGANYFYPVVQLMVMGHEFTHLVARNLNGSTADGADCHCGALNESFADIMGMVIYRNATGEINWNMGDNVTRKGVMRRFDDPEACGQPSCYLDSNFDTKGWEVHKNDGVQNHMYYLLVTGGEGVNSLGQDYAVTPMDIDEAEALTFNVLTNYTTSPMTYPDVAEAWANAAADRYGVGSDIHQSVCQAWAAVGISLGDITGIDQITSAASDMVTRYNLQGQPVGPDYRGLVIKR